MVLLMITLQVLNMKDLLDTHNIIYPTRVEHHFRPK